ncbi:MAG: hypothetical protein M3Y59_19505 [Myxococcota bacterium]|nr:hypothetical protein [Myxococcota bacterium]
MNSLPLHPALVHLPMGLAVALPILAIGLAWAIWKGKLGRTGWLAMVGLQALLVGGAFVALNTGEKEEEVVEAVVPEAAIEEHEEAAQQFTFAAVVTLVLAGLGVVRKSDRWLKIGSAATAVASVAVLLLGLRVGHEGGKLVYVHNAGAAHSTQQDAPGATPSAPRIKAEARTAEDHDD